MGGGRGRTLVAALVTATLAGASAAGAGELTVKGDVLHGKVVAITKTAIVFETIYGTGTIEIAYEDIEQLETEEQYVVLHGDDGEARGRLFGVRDDALLVGTSTDAATPIPIAAIVTAMTVADYEGAGIQALRSRWRYWQGTFDVGFSAAQSTIDTRALAIGLEANRVKGPSRLRGVARYHYGTTKERGEERTTTENELYGKLRWEYDLTGRWFGFTSADGEYDEVERISIRTVPKVGAGYHLYRADHAALALTAGPAWIYERFFDGSTNDAVALAFGVEGFLDLPYGARASAGVEYVPAVDDWTRDYLLRSEASLTVPMLAWVAFKASVYDQYDSTPAGGTDRNELTTSLGLSLSF